MLSYITGGKYAESLSDETARAFERQWTGKADEGVLKENGSGQKTLMEMFDDSVFGPATQEALERAKEVGIDVDAWSGKPVADFARAYGEAIKRDVIAGEHKILDGLRIVPGIGETDMPFYKELGQMKILQELGFDGILLPRFATEYLHRLYGVVLEKGSLPDGIVMLDDGKFVELKRISKKLKRSVRMALNGASDVIFVSSMKQLSQKDLQRIDELLNHDSGETQVVVLSEPDCRIYANFEEKIEGLMITMPPPSRQDRNPNSLNGKTSIPLP